jgi:hypothetical protein
VFERDQAARDYDFVVRFEPSFLGESQIVVESVVGKTMVIEHTSLSNIYRKLDSAVAKGGKEDVIEMAKLIEVRKREIEIPAAQAALWRKSLAESIAASAEVWKERSEKAKPYDVFRMRRAARSSNLWGAGTNRDTEPKQSQPHLKLTTSTMKQQYCRDEESGQNTLRLVLQLRYENIGQLPIILYKGSGVINREMVSLNYDDAANGKYAINILPSVYVQGTPEISGSNVPDKYFVVLPSGGVFEKTATTECVIFLKERNDRNYGGAVSSGEYLLQVGVSTFPYSDTSAATLRNRWQANGILWSDDITSAPMSFKVERNARLVDCNRLQTMTKR